MRGARVVLIGGTSNVGKSAVAQAVAGRLGFDSEGLSAFVDDREPVVALLAEARRRGMEVVISALTIIEATHRRTGRARPT